MFYFKADSEWIENFYVSVHSQLFQHKLILRVRGIFCGEMFWSPMTASSIMEKKMKGGLQEKLWDMVSVHLDPVVMGVSDTTTFLGEEMS